MPVAASAPPSGRGETDCYETCAGLIVEAVKAGGFDGILLDVDNGPEAFTAASNHRIYGRKGLAHLHSALRPGGTLVVWSSFHRPPFVRKLQQAGFAASSVACRARGKKGARHTLFVGRRR